MKMFIVDSESVYTFFGDEIFDRKEVRKNA